MTDSEKKTIYSVDANVFMDWQARFYPTDIFHSLLDKVDHLLNEERFFTPLLVREELEQVGTADLLKWTKGRPKLFIPLDAIISEAQKIQGQFPGLIDPKAEYEEADAYVIALAKLHDGIVVTQETAASEKRNPKRTHYVPDVCRELGIHCINFLGLMRREKWKF